YRLRCAKWVLPVLGDMPIDKISREQIGAIIRQVREAGRSIAVIEQIRNPLRTFYADLVERKVLTVNPAADLKHFVGRGANRRKKASQFFTQEEGSGLLKACKVQFPRWHAFIMTGLMAGLRWGESAALYRTDVDYRRGRIHVQRTVSGRSAIEAPKDHEGRHVKASPALLRALKAHAESVELDDVVEGRAPETR